MAGEEFPAKHERKSLESIVYDVRDSLGPFIRRDKVTRTTQKVSHDKTATAPTFFQTFSAVVQRTRNESEGIIESVSTWDTNIQEAANDPDAFGHPSTTVQIVQPIPPIADAGTPAASVGIGTIQVSDISRRIIPVDATKEILEIKQIAASVTERTTLTVDAEPASGTTFVLYDHNNSKVHFYFGSSVPILGAGERRVQIALTAGKTTTQYAEDIAAAIDADWAFNLIDQTDDAVRIDCVTSGARTDFEIVFPSSTTLSAVVTTQGTDAWPDPLKTDWEEDPETKLPIKVITQLVLPSSDPTTGTAGKSVTQRQVDASKALRVTRILDPDGSDDPQIPVGTQRTLYRNLRFTFPAVMGFGTGIEFVTNVVESDPDPEPSTDRRQHQVLINANKRAAFSRVVIAKIEISYHDPDDNPSPTAIDSILPSDLVYNGLFFNIGERQTLTDGPTVSASIIDDVLWNDIVESVDLSQMGSTPGALEYWNSWIGNYKVVGGDIDDWAFNLERKLVVSIQME